MKSKITGVIVVWVEADMFDIIPFVFEVGLLKRLQIIFFLVC